VSPESVSVSVQRIVTAWAPDVAGEVSVNLIDSGAQYDMGGLGRVIEPTNEANLQW